MSEKSNIQNNVTLPELHLEWIAEYLKVEGWNEIDAPNHPKLRVFEERSGGEVPLVVTLPQNSGMVDAKRRVADVLSTLAVEKDKSVGAIAHDIAALYSDVMIWRIPHTDADHTIPLSTAAEMINGLRDLLKYGAAAERDPRPFFSRVTDAGTHYMEQCRLKLTRPGSFIFEVEAPLADAFIEQVSDASLFSEEENNKIDDESKTFHRRVMERIAQGIHDVQAATAAESPDSLTDKYENGFNANLCETLGKMLETVGERGLEFSVRWSPLVEPPKMVQKTVLFQPEAIGYLKKAASELREVQRTNRTTITGKVVRLGMATSSQTIVMKYGQYQIRVPLNKADYRIACDAHRDGLSVKVTGVMEKRGRTRTLKGAADFEALSAPIPSANK